LWLNYGDSYNSGNEIGRHGGLGAKGIVDSPRQYGNRVTNLKPKDLCGIPWRIAFSLQADGWYLRSDIIWQKPNPMPESVEDRPTKSHEYLFLFSKRPRYYYDAEAVKEPANEGRLGKIERAFDNSDPSVTLRNSTGRAVLRKSSRNLRDVWEIPTQPYPEGHFATFPERLVFKPILAGSPPKCCGGCGVPWVRVVDKPKPPREVFTETAKPADGFVNRVDLPGGGIVGMGQKLQDWLNKNPTTTLGWRSGCEHDDDSGRAIVLDPFMGSGTVAKVARDHGRDYLGVELNPDYIRLAYKRMGQQVLGFAGI
jgi:hypothetical protein